MTVHVVADLPFNEDSDGATLVGTYFQTSRKYRIVARFPLGITDPNEALRDGLRHYDLESNFKTGVVREHEQAWASRMDPASAGDHFLRMYSTYRKELLQLELSPKQFDQFRKAGGDTYPMSLRLVRKVKARG